MDLLAPFRRRRSPLICSCETLDKFGEAFLVVDHSYTIQYANNLAAKLFNDQTLAGKHLRSPLPDDWPEVIGRWGFVASVTIFPPLSESMEIQRDGLPFQVRRFRLEVDGQEFLGILIIEFSREQAIFGERDRAIEELERSRRAAINIMEDLDTQRRELKSANRRMNDEITQKESAERQLAEHRDHLERLVQERTTELVQSQQELMRTQRLASVGALAAGIAHEINNPVGAIVLTTENALDEIGSLTDTESFRESFTRTCEKVLRHARRCGLIVKGVLQFARDQTAPKVLGNVNRIVENALRELSDGLMLRESKVETQLDPELPDIMLNSVAMQQVVINILSNAIDASRGRADIRIITTYISNHIFLSIKDFGPGMTEEQQRRMFDPFFTTRQNEGGTGLGMSIVNGIVEDHNGKIVVHSALNVGTEVVVQFPVPVEEVILNEGTQSKS